MKMQTQLQTLPVAVETPGSGSLFITVSGALVLLLLLAVVVIKGARFFGLGTPAVKGHKLLKLRGSLALGQRERVVVVEIEDRWLVLGVSPAGVTQLTTMDRGEVAEERPAAEDFRQMLKQRLKSGKAEAE